ncbi:MAG: lipocalin family protein, partial [Candidatus Eremiobacterota bacterium]
GRSKYYTFPRLEAEGTLTLDGQERRVKGSAWLDHQWGDMQIYNGYKGWDWFGIQLDNRTEINAFRFRGPEGENVQASVGMSHPDGTQSVSEQISLTPGRTWKSPTTGAEYPVEWHLSIPDKQVELDLKPTVDSQEMVGHPPYCYPELAPKPSYWEGSMQVTGTVGGQSVSGRAYTELVGYPGDQVLAEFDPSVVDLAERLAAETAAERG